MNYLSKTLETKTLETTFDIDHPDAIRISMLPPQAQKKMKSWIRSRHLIRSGNFFIFETVEYSTVEKFHDCLKAVGGTLISVDPVKKIWIGQHRRVVLYRAKASLHTPHHDLQAYWIKYGSFHTRFDERA